MNFFRRSSSISSTHSHTSTSSNTLTTPRTSTDSLPLEATIVLRKQPPLLALPVELIQHITTYLDAPSSASLCLCTRYLSYALGTAPLTGHLEAAKTRFERRSIIEGVVERAFPGHWFCAWCDVFHAWDASTSPSNILEKHRDCAAFNSYLPAGERYTYTLAYHHIRLALAHHALGPEYGIPLSALSYTQTSSPLLWRTPIPQTLSIEARISPTPEPHILLRTTLTLSLPTRLLPHKSLLPTLWPLLPPILTSHRATPNGHTGLMAALDNVLRRGWVYPATQLCSCCATDWSVHVHALPGGEWVRLVVRTWRDLGEGGSPFEGVWRAHGVGKSSGGMGGEVVRLVGGRAGDVRRGFDGADEDGVVERRGRREGEVGVEETLWTRARPRSWRTRSENEDARRREVEYRAALARGAAERLVRLDAEGRL
ncbi:hypothetical protein P153DRAFT_290658 [Dothidotthia symphoricarpi CBS 119687]|uniref:F-box domain-containing protein n=1 Tax=Dothidotthia symphoricarpi CBS 119687 TaxID=1392245 RepID=A0A6A6ABG9_9PLEO|nr:uncharacterized protein P153DRAFT_290658 [Dothidotthia symphoricarpi CBS 119687]KAF2129292.1 hypothetical protein P153DRAFT_290658 [Dothidotthia symphoricarpi CBS 119687]